MHILIATDAWYPMTNGVVRVIDSVRLRLFDRGHRATVVSPDQFATAPCPGCAEIPLAVAPQRRIRRFLKKDPPDVVHIATEEPLGWATRAACLRKGPPFTTAYHTKFPQYVTERLPVPVDWGYHVMRRFRAPSHWVFAPSRSVADDLIQRGFANVQEWAHGVDTRALRPRGKGFFDVPRPIFMNIGRIAVEKNLRGFLDLDLPGSKVVVGRGPDRDSLIDRYPDVHFHLAHGDDELSRCYSAADTFVFPSSTDTFGLVMLEAMACGVPVAAFPVSGPLDVFGADGPADTAFGVLDEDLAKNRASRSRQIPSSVPRVCRTLRLGRGDRPIPQPYRRHRRRTCAARDTHASAGGHYAGRITALGRFHRALGHSKLCGQSEPCRPCVFQVSFGTIFRAWGTKRVHRDNHGSE